jgi:hypothetical protein
MSQPNEKKAQESKSQAEFSVDITGENTHVEITLPSQQVKQILRPLALLLSHLVAAGLATVGMNPTLLESHETTPAPRPVKTLCIPHSDTPK